MDREILRKEVVREVYKRIVVTNVHEGGQALEEVMVMKFCGIVMSLENKRLEN